ncbi:hypothetical protein B0T10DRAFT_324887 [Thelonectria olida]|uniref:NmrA-like domain-containing protein n=1 Tax=Thelonectria olida TaxID=1576542 RepID=A0A9P8W6D2_9HYPO|nr:hypothetical protein B0T10DRAFT_324887 [Thelonectria olida]
MSTKPIEKIAIVGATGRIGGSFARALLETGKHTITALTRADSKSEVPEGLKAVKVDYDDEASVVEALKGQQFLIITLGARVPEDVHAKIVAAAGRAGVPYILPNSYGFPVVEERVQEGDHFAKLMVDRISSIWDTGVSTPVTLSCGYWYEWSLALGDFWFGINIKDRRVTFFDDGKRVITVSTWDQCGRAIAGLLGLPESGPSPSFADFKGKTVLINSFRVSQRDMLDSVNRVLGTTDADWDISYETTAKRIQDGEEEMKNGIFTGFAKVIYARVFAPSNPHSDFAKERTDNKVLGLPSEDLDEATRRAVDMVQSGWTPFAG